MDYWSSNTRDDYFEYVPNEKDYSTPVPWNSKASLEAGTFTSLLMASGDPKVTLETSGNMYTNAVDQGYSLAKDVVRRQYQEAALEEITEIARLPLSTDKKKEMVVATIPSNIVDLEREVLDTAGRPGVLTHREEFMARFESEIDRLEGEASSSDKVGAFIAPFGHRKPITAVYDRLGLGKGDILPSMDHTMRAKIRETIGNTPPEEQLELLQDIIDTLEENSGWFGENEYQTVDSLKSLYADLLTGEQDADIVTDYITSAVTVLDSTLVFPIIKNTVKGIGLLPPVVKSLGYTKPVEANKVMVAALGSDDVAKAIGLGRDEVAQILAPKFRGGMDDVAMPDPTGEIATAVSLGEDAQSLVHSLSGTGYKPAERASFLDNVQKELSEIVGIGMKPGWIHLTPDETGVYVKAIVSTPSGKGWNRWYKAKNAARQTFGKNANIAVLMDDGTGKLVPADTTGGIGSFYYQLLEHRPYRHDMIDSDILRVGKGEVSLAGLARSAYTAAASSRINRFYIQAGFVTHDTAHAVDARLWEMIEKPFVKGTNNAQKDNIIRALEEGAKSKRNWTYEELADPTGPFKFTDPAEFTGYTTVRLMQDTKYAINNDRVYHQLRKDGYKSIRTHGAARTSYLAKPIKQPDTAVKVFDPKSNTIVDMTPTDLKTLYDEGGTIASLKGRHEVPGVSGHYTTQVVVRTSDASVRALDRFPLTYRKGYLTTSYVDGYFIDIEKQIVVDGVEQTATFTVHSAPTLGEARGISDKLRAELGSDITVLNPRHGREIQALDAGDFAEKEWDLLTGTGKLVFSPKGPQLGKNKLDILDGLAEIKDPVQVAIDTNRMVANQAVFEPLINNYKMRYINSYGDLSPKLVEGSKRKVPSFPASREAIRAHGETGLITDSRITEARALYDYIRLLEGYHPSAFADGWRKQMIRTAEWVGGTSAKGWRRDLAKVIGTKVAERDGIRMARGLTFDWLVVANVLRQAVLQSQQILYLAAYNPKYMANLPRMAKELWQIRYGSYIKNDPTKWRAWIKHLTDKGEDVTSIKSAVNEWRGTGLHESVSSYSLGMDSVTSFERSRNLKFVGKTSEKVRHAYATAMGSLREVGFNFGERNNLSMTWLMVRDKYAREGKVGAKYAHEIAADTRTLALSMVPIDNFAYQRGWLSLMMQFVSVQHKAVSNVLPVRWGGSKAINRNTKVRLFLGNLATYGLAGTGFAAAADHLLTESGIEVTPETRDILMGGLLDWSVNAALNASTDDPEQTRLAISQDFGVLGGWYNTIFDTIKALFFSAEKPPIIEVLGPAGSLTSRVGKVISHSNTLWDADTFTPIQKLERMAKEISKLSGGMSNAWAARMMLATGKHVDSDGTVLAEELGASIYESIGRIFGIHSTDELDHWKNLLDLSKISKDVKAEARRIFKDLKFLEAQFEEGNLVEERDIRAALEAENLAINYDDDPVYKEMLIEEVMSMRASAEAKRKSGGVNTDTFTKMLMSSFLTLDTAQVMYTQLANSGASEESLARLKWQIAEGMQVQEKYGE